MVSGSGGSCIDIVEKAINICEANQEDNQKKGTPKYDEVFCVFDGDRPEYKKAMDDAQKYSAYKIKPILSIPCFELWFLLHYRFTSSPFTNCQELIDQLNKDLKKEKLKTYDKSKLDWYISLKPKLNDAIKNAQSLEKQLPESDSYANPSTKIHHLVTHLQAQKNFS